MWLFNSKPSVNNFRTVCRAGLFLITGKSQMLCLFIKKVRSTFYKFFGLFLYCLLPICGKIFERIIFNPIFEYLKKKGFLCPNQSGFRPFDLCEIQLLLIVHVKNNLFCHFWPNMGPHFGPKKAKIWNIRRRIWIFSPLERQKYVIT